MVQETKPNNELRDTFVALFNIKVEEQVSKLTNESYMFKVVTIDDINFQKIMDDLSYADPLRIVKVEDKLAAIVHHTIFDKAKRCLISTDANVIHSALRIGNAPIQPNEIKRIIKDIQLIKQAQWIKSPPKNIQVEVIKVKV